MSAKYEARALLMGYLAALAGLVIARFVLNLAAYPQFLVALSAFVVVNLLAWGLYGSGQLTALRSGRARVLGGLSLFAVITATNYMQNVSAESWPVIAIVVFLPLLILADVILAWKLNDRPAESVPSRGPTVS